MNFRQTFPLRIIAAGFYRRTLPVAVILLAVCILFPTVCGAGGDPEQIPLPGSLSTGLVHLLDLVNPAETVSFDPAKIAGVMDFIEKPEKDGILYYADDILGMPSAYLESDLHRSLGAVLAYAFNPDIPDVATMPSSVRLFHWLDHRGRRQPAPRLERNLAAPGKPMVLEGLQEVEITPDISSGAYYRYRLRYALVMFTFRQHRVLVTVTRQVDASGVGKKGYILGTDDDWDYLYSDETGLTIPALGWVKSYMYDSGAILVYDEMDPGTPQVRCAMFKWLRAGWAGINMVKRKHIYNGLKRFAGSYKEILEHPRLPPPQALAGRFAKIRGLSENQLTSRMQKYAALLKKRYLNSNHRNPEWPTELLDDRTYWRGLSRQQAQSALVIETIKYVVGKSREDEVARLLDLNP